MWILRSNLLAGLTDQAIVSFGNFALGVYLARLLPAADFGIYSVAMSFLLFLNALHQAVIIYPLSVKAASAPAPHVPQLLCIALVFSPLCGLIMLPMLAAALFTIMHLSLLCATFAALLAWQAQEVLRRGFLARRRPACAILLDAVRYIGPLPVVFLLAGRITVGDIFLIIALFSVLGIAPLIWRLRGGWTGMARRMPRALAVHWGLAAPILVANVLSAFTTQWFLWLLAWQHHAESAAALVALTNIVAITSPVILGIENILVPEIAHSRQSLTFAALMRLVGRHGAASMAFVAPLLFAVAAWPTQIAQLVYGQATPYALHPAALKMLAGVYACYLLSGILGATLRGYRAGSATLHTQLYPALVGVTLGSWLTLGFGLEGAAMASLLAGLVRVGTGWHHVMQLRTKSAPLEVTLAAP